MLVLTRKAGERIVIGENVEISVVRIRGNRVRLGVSAPRQIAVRRREVRKQIEELHFEQQGPSCTQDP